LLRNKCVSYIQYSARVENSAQVQTYYLMFVNGRYQSQHKGKALFATLSINALGINCRCAEFLVYFIVKLNFILPSVFMASFMPRNNKLERWSFKNM
jgi:hypothetical protein